MITLGLDLRPDHAARLAEVQASWDEVTEWRRARGWRGDKRRSLAWLLRHHPTVSPPRARPRRRRPGGAELHDLQYQGPEGLHDSV